MENGDVIITKLPNGVTHFEPAQKHEPDQQMQLEKNWLGKLVDWWRSSWIRPYVKIRDTADPFGDRHDPECGCDGDIAAEAGVQIRF